MEAEEFKQYLLSKEEQEKDDEEPDVTYIEIDGVIVIIPNFRASRLSSCYWNYSRDLTDPLPILASLQKIFDDGTEIHETDEKWTKGSKGIISSEVARKIIHNSLLYTVSGHHDLKKQDNRGRFYEDMKSCQKGSFFYFVSFIDKGLPKDYIKQMGVYSFLEYIYGEDFLEYGVITRIQKDSDHKDKLGRYRNRASIEDRLPPIEFMRKFLTKHPVILFKTGQKDENWLIQQTIRQMSKKDAQGKDQTWKCINKSTQCQYLEGCPIRTELGYQ